MTIPLDEARLRGWIDEATDAVLPPVCDVTGNGTKARAQMQVDIADRLMPALLDALSAERERGDRAVGLLRPFGEAAENLYDDHADNSAIWESGAAMGIDAGDLRRAQAFLLKDGAVQ